MVDHFISSLALRDTCEKEIPQEGKVLGEHFKQILPVVSHSSSPGHNQQLFQKQFTLANNQRPQVDKMGEEIR